MRQPSPTGIVNKQTITIDGEQVQNTTDYESETSLGPCLDILPGIANGAMVQSQAVTIAI